MGTVTLRGRFAHQLVAFFAVSTVVLGGCKAKRGEPCAIPKDCQGDLICFCPEWGPYECKQPQVCTTTADATAICGKQLSCRNDGICVAPERRELADNAIPMCRSTPETCRAHEGCARRGQCTSTRGVCVAASKDDCERSEGCKDGGACSLANEICVNK